MGDDGYPTRLKCSPPNFRLQDQQRGALEVEFNAAIPCLTRALALDKARAE